MLSPGTDRITMITTLRQQGFTLREAGDMVRDLRLVKADPVTGQASLTTRGAIIRPRVLPSRSSMIEGTALYVTHLVARNEDW